MPCSRVAMRWVCGSATVSLRRCGVLPCDSRWPLRCSWSSWWCSGWRSPRSRALVGSLLYGLFNFAGSFGLGYYGLVQVHAGLGQILLALVPLATLLLAVLWRQERLRAAAIIGTLLALAGVAVISYTPLQNNVPRCRCSP
jgi:drug/metabolite transporter (DMT)-like permease